MPVACFPRDLASAAAEVESHPVRQKETPGLSGRFSVVISSGVWYTRFDLSGIGGGKMIKLFGKNNDLRTEEGIITRTGYAVMALSSVFGLCVLLAGRAAYGKLQQKKRTD